MSLQVFEVGEYGVRAVDEIEALDTIREYEGENVADDLTDSGYYPRQLGDDSRKTINMGTDEEPLLVTKTCAAWIASATSDILWRPA